MQPSPDSSDNPFATPEAQDVRVGEVLPELHGGRPASVALAMLCVVGVLVLNTLLLVVAAVAGEEVMLAVLLPSFLAGGLILLGIARRSRLARRAARTLSLLGGVLGLLWIGLVAIGLLALFDPNSGVGIAASSDSTGLLVSLGIGLVIFVLPVVMLWTIFVALGRPAAVCYFGLFCPECRGRRARALDFFFRKAECKTCGHRWS